MITLVRVADIGAERVLSRRLCGLRAELGRFVAPVLDRGGLPDKIVTLLREHGADVEIVEQVPSTSAAFTNSSPSAMAAGNHPDLLIASPGIGDDVLELAAGLCGARVLPLSATAGEIGNTVHPGKCTALLLLNTDATPPAAIVAAVQRLETLQVRWGLLYALDAVAARFAILKTLLVDRVEASGRFGFMSSAYAPRAGEGAPDWLRPLGSRDGRSFFEARHDVLLLSGHANALDASIGADLIVCARHGAKNGGADVLPCFSDGVCFRQPAAGPRRELLDPRGLRARVLVMSGCNLLPLAQAWFATRSSLVHQVATESDVLAVIAASVATVVRLDLDLLCLALIAEGLPLGEVVWELNRVRREVLRHSTGLPAGIGPYVLLGNPALRVSGFEIETVPYEEIDPCAEESQRFLRIVPTRCTTDPGRGALLRCPIAPRGALPYLTLQDAEESAWCRGVRHERGQQVMLYLWRGGQTGEPLVLEVCSQDSWQPVRRAIDSFWAELTFWMQFLDCYRSEMRTLSHPTQLLDGLAADLPAFARNLAGISDAMRPTIGEVASRRSLLELTSAAWRELALWSDTLLGATVEAIVRTGRVHSYGTSPFYRLAEVVEVAEACLCPGGLMTGQAFLSPDARLRRVEYQCGLCGASSDEDGRSLLRILHCSEITHIGDRFRCECRCIAPEDAQLHVHAALILEPWSTGTHITSRTHRDILAPNVSSCFHLEMPIPEHLSEGAYPVTVVAIVNGALYILRRMLRVSRSR